MFEKEFEESYGKWKLSVLGDGIYRVQLLKSKTQRESMLTRYGILKTELGEVVCRVHQNTVFTNTGTVTYEGGSFTFLSEGHSLRLDAEASAKESDAESGFSVSLPIEKEERFFGLGDISRDGIEKRGRIYELWEQNVKCYGPVPYLMSSRGWSILCNTTYRHRYDIGASDPDTLKITSDKGSLDFFIFLSDSMKGALRKYTAVAGRPVLLPKAAYGLTFVNNERETERDTLENCVSFRRAQIPCDIMGLEPGWMSRHYDYSVDKKWSEDRFYMPYWLPDNYYGHCSFIWSMHKMGYKLSLWLCCDYDLLWKEEKDAKERAVQKTDADAYDDDAKIRDTHLTGAVRMDHLTQPGQNWFDHLQKFVDNGADAFKLDGANQVMEHPDRLYAGKYTDDEVHNVYPVLYGKQMKEGFAEYTGRRAMIYTPCMYAGQQQYCATWAGDTGGGPKTLISVMNLGLCGHANASCDLDANTLCGLHYGVLMPWTQHLAWRSWDAPWYVGEEAETIYRFYMQLRSRLFPYIYSTAHQANTEGIPMLRPLSLAFEGHPEYDSILTEYMFGDHLLISAFDPKVTLPQGRFTDFFTGHLYEGGQTICYTPPKDRGGALFVKDGAILPMQDWQPHLTQHVPAKYFIHVFPGADGRFVLYEDDGETYAYEKGEFAETEFRLQGNTLTVGQRRGFYRWISPQRIPADQDEALSYVKPIDGMPPVCPMEIILHNVGQDTEILLEETKIETTCQNGCLSFEIPAALHESRVLHYVIRQSSL